MEPVLSLAWPEETVVLQGNLYRIAEAIVDFTSIDIISRDLDVEVGKTSASGKFSLEATRCIGACGLAPVLTVNEDVYGRLVDGDIPGILEKYKGL